jgi:hypothetical protein
LFNFGRADQLDLDAICRLIKSLSKLVGSDEAAAIQQKLDNNDTIGFWGSPNSLFAGRYVAKPKN